MPRPTIDEVQPYYRAYMLAHGLTEAPPPPHHEFLFWIQGQWHEWGVENGIGRENPLTQQHRDEFGQWLKAKTEPASAA